MCDRDIDRDIDHSQNIKDPKIRKQMNNRKFYINHKDENHRSSLLCAVQKKGRVPKLESVTKYNIEIGELVNRWRAYCQSRPRDSIRPLKILKFQTLLLNMV